VDLAAEQHVDRESEHDDAASDINRRVLRRQELSQHRRSQGNGENDRGDAGGEEKGHRDQQAAVLKRAGEVGGEHHRDTAGSKQRNCPCDNRSQHRTTEEDASIHQVS
jgi:hypothetical protein